MIQFLLERFDDVREQAGTSTGARKEWSASCPLCHPDEPQRFRIDPDMRISACASGHAPDAILGAADAFRREEPGADDGDPEPIATAPHATPSLGLADFFATCDAQIEWLLEPYVFKGGFTLVQGAPKSGKTWLVAWLAAAVAARGRTVLFVEEEGAREVLRDRLRPFVPDAKAANDTLRVMFRQRVRLDSTRSVEALINEAKRTHAQLVILDPFIALHGKREKESDEMAMVLGAIRELITATGCAVVLVHHTRKGDSWSKTSTQDASSEDARGSGALVGEVDIVVAVKGVPPAKRKEGEVRIVVENPDTRVGAPFMKRLLSIDLANGTIAELDEGPKSDPVERASEMLLRVLPLLPVPPQSVSRDHLRESMRVRRAELVEAVALGVDRDLILEPSKGKLSLNPDRSRKDAGRIGNDGTITGSHPSRSLPIGNGGKDGTIRQTGLGKDLVEDEP